MQSLMIKDLNDKTYRDMKEYCVEFNYGCCSHYTVEFKNEDEAIEIAENDFRAEMNCPIEDTTYEVEVEEV